MVTCDADMTSVTFIKNKTAKSLCIHVYTQTWCISGRNGGGGGSSGGGGVGGSSGVGVGVGGGGGVEILSQNMECNRELQG